MSGTSLDGVDVVLVSFKTETPNLLQTYFLPYQQSLRQQLLLLHQSGDDELNRAAILSNRLSHLYAEAVSALLEESGLAAEQIVAIGCHGQTIRHCPEKSKNYTIQLVNAALLAELTSITVVADFRSRDIAAGGQGAPLVPAFHDAIFNDTEHHRVIVNIGGIANITNLNPRATIAGFDCGPGNLLMDAWCFRHRGDTYDQNGEWAETGRVIPALLTAMLAESFFVYEPPKSTGRDLFNLQWLEDKLTGNELPQDVQATLLQLTVTAIADAVMNYCSGAEAVYVCGGGAHNISLMRKLGRALPGKYLATSDQLGVAADWVEALAFAWLARQTLLRRPGNISAVTGAKGSRVLGAIYPA